MTRFRIVLTLCIAAVAGALWLGDRPERRYVNAECQYRMIHQDTDEMGLVSVGGSRILTAVDSHHLNALLDASGKAHAPAFNLAHSHYTLAKEYVLLRDLFDRGWAPRSVVVMIQPRGKRAGAIHPEFAEIARLSDIPLSMRALWSEDPWAAISGAALILRHHFKFWEEVRLRKGTSLSERTDNCHLGDYRLTLDELERGVAARKQAELNGPMDWKVEEPSEEFNRIYIRAIADLARDHGAEAIFLNLTRAGILPPDPAFAEKFRDATGSPAIILPPELMARIDHSGRRDRMHINAQGRAYFLPWLISQIENACTAPSGCF